MATVIPVPEDVTDFDYGLELARTYLIKLDKAEALNRLLELDPGECDDCTDTAQADRADVDRQPRIYRDRWRFGKRDLCRRCAITRLAIRTELEDAQ